MPENRPLMSTAEGITDEVEEVNDEEDEEGREKGTQGRGKKKRRKKKGACHAVYVAPEYASNLKVVNSPVQGGGRCAVAARELGEGELVFTEEPVSLVVFRGRKSCHLCGRAPVTVLDDGYPTCSKRCLDLNSAAHRLARPALLLVDEIAREEGIDAELLALVLLLVCQRRALLAKGGTGERRWHDVDTLMDHKDRAPQAFLQALARALGRLLDLLPEEARVPVDVAVRLGCVINVNSHGITPGSPHSSAVGCGLFPLLAMLNHSCRPSVAFFFEDGRMRVRTLRALKAGEELTVPYVNMLSRRDRRRRDLQQGKHFYCRCARCEEHSAADQLLEAVCCARCGERAVLVREGDTGVDEHEHDHDGMGAAARALGQASLEDGQAGGGGQGAWRCGVCGRAFGGPEVSAYTQAVEAEREQASMLMRAQMHGPAKAQWEAFLAKHDAAQPLPKGTKPEQLPLRLHPQHHLLVESLLPLVNCCNKAGELSQAASHLRRLLGVCSAVFPKNFPELGNMQQALGEVLTHIIAARGAALPKKTAAAMRSECREAFRKAMEVRRVAFGDTHALTQESRRAWEAAGGRA